MVSESSRSSFVVSGFLRKEDHCSVNSQGPLHEWLAQQYKAAKYLPINSLSNWLKSPFICYGPERARPTAQLPFLHLQAILDFASLYPSLFIGHNLCYSTLLHPDDVAGLKEEDVLTTPTGAHFVKTSVRHGILPRICGALIATRKQVRCRPGCGSLFKVVASGGLRLSLSYLRRGWNQVAVRDRTQLL
jgi:hypothetical protein